MNSPRRKRSFYIYLKSNICLYQIDAGWFDEDGAGWSFAQSQAGGLWQADFSRAGSVREGCSALRAFSARLGCLLMGSVSVVLVATHLQTTPFEVGHYHYPHFTHGETETLADVVVMAESL